MKIKLNKFTVVVVLLGVISIQNAFAQAANSHPTTKALKVLQPFIGNWTGEFKAIGGFEGLEKGRIVAGTERVKWISNKTAVQITWDNKFKDDGKPFNFGTGIILLIHLPRNLIGILLVTMGKYIGLVKE